MSRKNLSEADIWFDRTSKSNVWCTLEIYRMTGYKHRPITSTAFEARAKHRSLLGYKHRVRSLVNTVLAAMLLPQVEYGSEEAIFHGNLDIWRCPVPS